MYFASWIARVQRTIGRRYDRKARRRVQWTEISARCAHVEEFEKRALLSAAPVIVLSPPGPLNYVEHSGPVVIAPNSTVTDADSPNFNGGTFTESLTANANAADQLAIRNQGTAAGQIAVVGNMVEFGGVAIGTFTGGAGSTPLVVTLNASATPTAVTALQDNITFQTTADSAASVSAPRTFQSVVTDGPSPIGNASTPVTETINVVEANPIIALHQGPLTVSNSAPFIIAPNATISSPETHDLAGGTLTVSLTNGTSRDSLAIESHGASRAISTSGNTVFDNGVAIGTFTGGQGTTPLVITFNSNATIADAQAVARSVTFRSIGHFAHQTDVKFQLTDGDGGVSDVARVALTIIHGHNPHGQGGNGQGQNGNGQGQNGNGQGGHGNHGHHG